MRLFRLRPSARFFSRGFAGLALLLTAVAVGMHVYRMSGIAFHNYDDLITGMTADRIRLHGWKAYWDGVSHYAVWQGRAFFYFSSIFFVLPFFLRSLFWRGLLAALAQFAATCSVGAVVGLYAGFRNAALYVALACASLPYWHHWYPVNGYGIIFHLPVLLFFAGLAVYIRRARGQIQPAWRRFSRIFSWTAFALSLFFMAPALRCLLCSRRCLVMTPSMLDW